MLRELRGDPDRYTPPHLRGGKGFYTPSTRTSPTSSSATFYQDAKISSQVQHDESFCENLRKIETSSDFMYEVIEIRDRNPAKSSDSINQELK